DLVFYVTISPYQPASSARVKIGSHGSIPRETHGARPQPRVSAQRDLKCPLRARHAPGPTCLQRAEQGAPNAQAARPVTPDLWAPEAATGVPTAAHPRRIEPLRGLSLASAQERIRMAIEIIGQLPHGARGLAELVH